MTGTITVQASTDVDDTCNDQLPRVLDVREYYPIQFKPSTTIPYSLPNRTRVQVEVFNILGQRVTTLLDREQPAGAHTVDWSGKDDSGVPVPSGIYLYRVTIEEFAVTRKMTLLK